MGVRAVTPNIKPIIQSALDISSVSADLQCISFHQLYSVTLTLYIATYSARQNVGGL